MLLRLIEPGIADGAAEALSKKALLPQRFVSQMLNGWKEELKTDLTPLGFTQLLCEACNGEKGANI